MTSSRLITAALSSLHPRSHGGRDRHFCIGVADIDPLTSKLDAAGVPYTRSASGRPAIFFRDPDANVIECVEGADPWR
ncbi:hypothetical protein MNEG_12766 [Monoraphidium neglectum]|uniref:VOC domain-containing protein n=1 Tax=Monoraphidium neglectum TaxID=145388 RepID=A0A0D2MJT0_9CHLO|nr:hypothetical protein MNEG_12766 [Monoraphidium neglectum]KIY95195.1 hypothetical protein MNEG_12766 [Monoraphidium neglectum]|eukprot:XP_013894215.1 hypothetical protein MNEG_12766 [Monoraphidium neglectum]